MTEIRKLKVFICHSKDDKPKVRELYRRLVDDVVDVWLDEEKLMPGQDWDLVIRKAVRESDVVVICLSNDSITKAGYVQKEIRFALDVADEQPEGAIFLIPAKLEECQVPSRLSKLQWVNLFDNYGYKRLKSALSKQASILGISSHEGGVTPIRVEEIFRRVWIGEKRFACQQHHSNCLCCYTTKAQIQLLMLKFFLLQIFSHFKKELQLTENGCG